MVGKLEKGGIFWCKARIFWGLPFGVQNFVNTLRQESPLYLRPCRNGKNRIAQCVHVSKIVSYPLVGEYINAKISNGPKWNT